MGLLNEEGDQLARRVQRGLVRAGMKDVTTLSVQPASGRRLVLRHGPSLYRVHVYPVRRRPTALEGEQGWLPLLVSTTFDDATLGELADEGASFLDDRGNAHLFINGQTVLFARAAGQGREGASVPHASRARPRANQPAGVLSLNRASHQVVFALLCAPDLADKSIRALAATANVSLGTVHNTLANLTQAGHLLDGQLRNTGRLLDAWAETYRRLAIAPLATRPLYAPGWEWAEQLRLDPRRDVLLGGAAAAGMLTGQLRSTDGIAYTSDVGSAVKLLRLTPTPTAFRVELRQRFWGEGLPSTLPGLVPSVLVYGDLLRDSDDRSLETAATLRRDDAHLCTLV